MSSDWVNEFDSELKRKYLTWEGNNLVRKDPEIRPGHGIRPALH